MKQGYLTTDLHRNLFKKALSALSMIILSPTANGLTGTSTFTPDTTSS